jgi:hypothetical protein
MTVKLIDRNTSDTTIRALRIPMHDTPSLLDDDYESLVRYVFYTKQVYTVPLNEDNSLILSPKFMGDYQEVNFLATALFKIYNLNPSPSKNIIYGPALAVGCPLHGLSDFQSITNTLVEEVINILNIYTYKNLPLIRQ